MGVKQKRKLVFSGIVSLLFAFSPVIAAAADDTTTTTVIATVNSVISIETSGTVAIALTPTTSPVVSSNNDVVEVSTNNMTGYNLTIQDTDTTTDLSGTGVNKFTSIGVGIGAATALTNGTWGFAVATGTTGIGTNSFDASYGAESSNTTSTSKWAGVPASSGAAISIKSTSSVAVGDTTSVWFAARAAASQPADTYQNTVRYTATTNI